MDQKELNDPLNDLSLIKGNPTLLYIFFFYSDKKGRIELQSVTLHFFISVPASYLAQHILTMSGEKKIMSHTSEHL